MQKRSVLAVFLSLFCIPSAFAVAGGDYSRYDPLGVWNVVTFASIAIAIFTAIALTIGSKLSDLHKKALYGTLFAIITLATAYIVLSTVTLNVSSHTKGPVHWHIDFEIWACGERIDLVDPKGLSNKIGTSVFHEHNDFRIHVEGPVLEPSNVDMKSFFSVIGGSMQNGKISIPTNEGILEFKDGDTCKGVPAQWNAFLFSVSNPSEHNQWVMTTQKLPDYPNHVMAPQTTVPPGDCLVLEFGPPSDSTPHLCSTYRNAIEKGDMHGG